MRWVIGVTLAWFVIVNLANLKEYLKYPRPYSRGGILACGLGLGGSVTGLAGLIFRWGI
jgi:hypothetical protein